VQSHFLKIAKSINDIIVVVAVVVVVVAVVAVAFMAPIIHCNVKETKFAEPGKM